MTRLQKRELNEVVIQLLSHSHIDHKTSQAYLQRLADAILAELKARL